MKKNTLLLIILFTINSFSQIPDNKSLIADMNNFYNKGKIEKLEIITSEILSGKYGLMDDELKFYALMYSSNVYSRDEYAKKDAQKGYDKLFELLVFAKSTSYTIPNKEAYIKSMSEYLITYKNKHPEVKVSVKENENKAVTEVKTETVNENVQINTIETNTTPKSTSDDKTVTLTVSGTGKTLEEAKINALRSAIEQAFGAFISSKTEILNDNLVKDEIVSISNGNIQKYDIVSQVEMPSIGYAITLNVAVSIENLSSFAVSKGVEVEFKGGMFGTSIKLQKLNEKNELAACINLFDVMHENMQNAYDFLLETGQPQLFKDDDYQIKFHVEAIPNDLYKSSMDYFYKTLKAIALSRNEQLNYEETRKPTYLVEGYYLRNDYSAQTLNLISELKNFYTGNFQIIINDDSSNPILGPNLAYIKDYHNSDGKLKEISFLEGGPMGWSDTYSFGFDSYFKFNCKKGDNCYTWNQLYNLTEIENLSKIKVMSRGEISYFNYGGFVIHNDEKRYIIAAPFDVTVNDLQNFVYKPVKTKKDIFTGKENTAAFNGEIEEKNLFNLVAKLNNKYSTTWFIPSQDELILTMTTLSFIKKKGNYLSSTIYPSEFGTGNYYDNTKQIYCFKSDYNFESILTNPKLKKYLRGNPFNITEILKITDNLPKFNGNEKIIQLYNANRIKLIKYVDIN
ncbi:hypothetical protein [Flavobacterium sp.]|uniref:hypothetical protein n=1 Tax=Flavobacterium sp. TaxID=239 RepID=UPI0022C5DF37|nr:hypothetical protein [Flavobacterium sp.]MCZ8167691.1 hypothetical protein [Flavobacterium sp.]